MYAATPWLITPVAERYGVSEGAVGAVSVAQVGAFAAANFVLNDLLREQNAAGHGAEEIPLPAAHLAELIRLVEDGTISNSVARRDLF